MKQILEPLANIPGVRSAILATTDGVPIAMQGLGLAESIEVEPGEGASSIGVGSAPAQLQRNEGIDGSTEINVLAGLGSSWLCEVTRTIAPLAWAAPKYMVLRAVRGTLIVMQAPNAILLVVLDEGIRADDLRLPMEGAIVRLQRMLRGIGGRKKQEAPQTQEQPAAYFPHNKTISVEAVADQVKGFPE